jgi:hypothetical protein
VHGQKVALNNLTDIVPMRRVNWFRPDIFILQLAAIIVMVTGCYTGAVGKSTHQPSIQRGEAVNLAEQEARRRGWHDVEVQAVQFREGHWLVLVQRLPVVPGGHALVEISSGGNIIQFRPGK